MTEGVLDDKRSTSNDSDSGDSLPHVTAINHAEGKPSTAPFRRPALTRLVSQEALFAMDGPTLSNAQENLDGLAKEKEGRCSPVRCVSEFDKAARNKVDDIPPLPNPLQNHRFLTFHARALRLEAELHPMRLILSRLMAHVTHNRKGLFNAPVDPAALGLPDYFTIIKKPMDLGTVKTRLHAVAYENREQVAEDIRLVFQNAMKYNPPHNGVHVSARELLACFEKAYCELDALPPCGDGTAASASRSLLRAVSSVTEADGRGDCAPAITQPQTDPSLHTRTHPPTELAPALQASTKRRCRVSKTRHSCHECAGRICSMCKQGCLPHEPALLICAGAACAGTKIRKGATYYTAKDGSRQFCQRCYAGLAAVIPQTDEQDSLRYKRDLLKRKNEEEIVERWLTCGGCGSGVHYVCAMYNDYVHGPESFRCPGCSVAPDAGEAVMAHISAMERESEFYTFVSGSDFPVPMSQATGQTLSHHPDLALTSEGLRETELSKFIQDKVQERMTSANVPNAERTVVVRVISECDKCFKVPDVVRKHFRMETENSDRIVPPPAKVKYHSQAIALFQKLDGLDVCVFCMYVHEYDGDDEYEQDTDKLHAKSGKRIYIAYIDSVEHFRPRRCRTGVYHEILVAYLATARARGYETAHIWACPPSRGNSFVFWNHPASQRTPNRERLVAWYHGAISHAIDCGVVTDVQSLYESDFKRCMDKIEKSKTPEQDCIAPGKMVCPPLFDGDFWIEEASRIHATVLARHFRTKGTFDETRSKPLSPPDVEELAVNCPAAQVAGLLLHRVMAHPSCVAFRRPVNAAAMKLKDYHKIISKPMDLGTVYSRCLLGEYQLLRQLVSDVELVFSNARLYNPKGHFVHNYAIEMESLFFRELDELTGTWKPDDPAEKHSWRLCANMSMSLDVLLERPVPMVEEVQAASSETSSDISGDTQVSQGCLLPKGQDLFPDVVSVAASVSPTPSTSMKNNTKKTKKTTPVKTLDLFHDGPEAVEQRMVGEDVWLMDKNPVPPKGFPTYKKGGGKRRRNPADSGEEGCPLRKRRRQSWLGEEVGASVRRSRTSCFTCVLVPKKEGISKQEEDKLAAFSRYVASFPGCSGSSRGGTASSSIADARHALLEFSQFRNLEFDTLRRAKYSTAILLYHLHHENAPGTVPACTSCRQDITEVRWHKVMKVNERRRTSRTPPAMKASLDHEDPRCAAEELCSPCHAKRAKDEEFIPIPVSFRPGGVVRSSG